MMELETDRLILRPYTMDDLDFYAALWSDPEVVRCIGAGVTRSRDEAEERLQRIIVGYGVTRRRDEAADDELLPEADRSYVDDPFGNRLPFDPSS